MAFQYPTSDYSDSSDSSLDDGSLIIILLPIMIYGIITASPRWTTDHEVEAVHAAETKSATGRLCVCTHCSSLPSVFRARLNLDKLESQHVRWSTEDRQKSKSIPERPNQPRSSVMPWSRCTPATRACYSGLLVLLILQLLPAHYWVTAKDFWCNEAWPLIKDDIDQMMKDDEPEFPKDLQAIAGIVALIFGTILCSPRFQPRHEVEAVHAEDMKGAGWLDDGVLCTCSGCTLGPSVLRARLDLDKLEAQHVRWIPDKEEPEEMQMR